MPDECPLCRGEPYPDDLVEMVLSAQPTGNRMTGDEFLEWLSRVMAKPFS